MKNLKTEYVIMNEYSRYADKMTSSKLTFTHHSIDVEYLVKHGVHEEKMDILGEVVNDHFEDEVFLLRNSINQSHENHQFYNVLRQPETSTYNRIGFIEILKDSFFQPAE